MKIETVLLGDICEVIAGQSPPSSTYNTKGEGLPFFQGKADFGRTSPVVRIWCSVPQKIAEKGDILISVRAPVGPTNLCDQRSCIGRGLSAIRTGERVDTGYLLHFLKSFEAKLANKGRGSTFSSITQKDLREIQIPLPSLEEQKRIVRELDAADALRQKRKQAISLLDDYLKAVFFEIFGDPMTNPKGWDKCNLNEVVDIQSGQVDPKSEPYASMIHIGGADIESNTGKIINRVTAKEARQISGKYLFDRNYLLYSKIRPYLNKVALPNFEGICSADIYPIRPKEAITKGFLAYILKSKAFLEHAEANSGRANIPKINRPDLLKFQIIIPPLSEQKNFEKIYAKIDFLKHLLVDQLEQIELNFNAQMQGDFK